MPTAKRKSDTKTLEAPALALADIAAHGAFEQVATDARARILITAHRDRTVRVNDLTSKTEHLLGRHARRVQALATDGQARWAVSAGKDVLVWNVGDRDRGRPIADLSGVLSLSAADKGVFVAAGSDGVALIDAPTARIRRKLDPFDGLAATSAVLSGGRLIAGSESGAVTCIDIRTGATIWTRKIGTHPVNLAMHEGHEWLVASTSKPCVLAASSGKVSAQPSGAASSVGGVLCVGIVGDLVVTGGYDGSLRAWNVKTNALVRVGAFKYAVMALATAAKADAVVGISGRQIQGWTLSA